ncbi:MAG: argininosuccinate lyase, partial [Butyrivibrio sp.]|nr:argininosuccinate lyase [Butyrivibrio sp.]
IPLAYNKDMQEDKEAAFDAMDTVKHCVTLYTDMLKTLKFNKENMEKSASKGFTNATDAADYLVNKGMPFRDAHSVIGQLVLYCIDKECAIDDLRLSELKRFSELFEEDIYDAISLKTCVEKRLTIGAPSKEAMMRVITENEALLMGFKLM